MRFIKAMEMNLRHNLCKKRIYGIWKHMNQRCSNVKCNKYRQYGGRGIKICDEWKNNPKAFYDWSLSHGYKDNLSIDRINVNGNYEPNNCRWATDKQQACNRTTTLHIEHNGETHNLKEWSIILDEPYSTLWNRYKKYKTIFKEEI